MLVYQGKAVGIELFSYVTPFIGFMLLVHSFRTEI